MLLEIAVLIIALSVAVLTAAFVQTLRQARTSLERASEALREVQDAVRIWKDDVEKLASSLNGLTERAGRQLDAVDPLMSSFRNVGETLREITAAAHEVSAGWASLLKTKADKAAARMEAKAALGERSGIAGGGASRSDPASAMPGSPGLGTDRHALRNRQAAPPPGWLDWLDVAVQTVRLLRR